MRGHAFCSAHCKFIKEQHSEIPTVLRDFLKYCGVMSEGKHCNSVSRCKCNFITAASETINVESDVSRVEEVVNKLPSTEDIGKLAANSQGLHRQVQEANIHILSPQE